MIQLLKKWAIKFFQQDKDLSNVLYTMRYALQQSYEEKNAAMLLRVKTVGHSGYETIHSLSQT